MKEKVKWIICLVAFVIIVIGAFVLINNLSNNSKPIVENTTQDTKDVKNEILEVTEETFEKEVLNSDKKVLIDFYAIWCIPCRTLKPKINEIAAEHPEIKVVSIDVDKAPNISNKYNIYAIPTLVVIENGNEINRAVGTIEKDIIVEILGIK